MARNSRNQRSPAIHRQRTLRVLGTDISLLEAVRLKAIVDLGFNIEFEVLDFPNCQRKAALKGKAVILVDDIYTSGATANACARILRRAGAARVDVLCWARVVRPEHAA